MLSMKGEASLELLSQKDNRYCSCQRVEERKQKVASGEHKGQRHLIKERGKVEENEKYDDCYIGRDSAEEHLK